MISSSHEDERYAQVKRPGDPPPRQRSEHERDESHVESGDEHVGPEHHPVDSALFRLQAFEQGLGTEAGEVGFALALPGGFQFVEIHGWSPRLQRVESFFLAR